MVVRPIIFSAPMVRALLEGRKTQTRRAWKAQPPDDWRPFGYGEVHGTDRDGEYDPDKVIGWGPHDDDGIAYRAPYAPGDLLYVREAWGHDAPDLDACRRGIESDGPSFGPYYMADGNWADNHTIRRRPSIHMPRWASRLTLAVTDVRVQRLQKISEEDAADEGVNPVLIPPDGGSCPCVEGFRELWGTLHGPGAWAMNPWVVAVTFDVHKANVDQFVEANKKVAAE
jgi:hypothetical protein